MLSFITDIPPRTSQQPSWSSVASQSIASTHPIGSLSNTAATNSGNATSTWNTGQIPAHSSNSASPNTMINLRDRKETNSREDRGDTMMKQGPAMYQDQNMIRTVPNKVRHKMVLSFNAPHPSLKNGVLDGVMRH